MDRVPSKSGGPTAAENAIYRQQLQQELSAAMRGRDPTRAQITWLKYGIEDGVEWTYPQLASRFGITANVAKAIVRSELAFLRHSKKRELQDFVGHG
jgi:DNA-directed RNA polymerase sigma subunit (sigma70/sigma32)